MSEDIKSPTVGQANEGEPDRRFCAMIKAARENAGYSVDRVANATRIKAEFIHALEKGQVEVLPGLVFARGFIKNLSRLYQVNPESYLEAFDAMTKPRDVASAAPESLVIGANRHESETQAKAIARDKAGLPDLPGAEATTGTVLQPFSQWSSTGRLAAVIVALVAVGGVTVRLLSTRKATVPQEQLAVKPEAAVTADPMLAESGNENGEGAETLVPSNQPLPEDSQSVATVNDEANSQASATEPVAPSAAASLAANQATPPAPTLPASAVKQEAAPAAATPSSANSPAAPSVAATAATAQSPAATPTTASPAAQTPAGPTTAATSNVGGESGRPQVLEIFAKEAVKIKLKKDEGGWETIQLEPKAYRYEFHEMAQLMVYDAAAVGVSYNGRDLGSLGGKGRIRRLSFHGLDLGAATAKKP